MRKRAREWPPTVVGLEGPVCSGKSTFASRLTQAFPGTLVFDDYVSGLRDGRVPNFDPGSTEGQLDAFELFMAVEADRIRARTAEPRRAYILDRTVDTLFAHTYGLDRLQGYEAYPRIREDTEPERYLIPDVTFLLQPPRDVLLRRAKQRGDEELLAPFLSVDFLAATTAYFNEEPVSPRIVRLTLDQYTDAIPGVVSEVLSGS